MEAVGDRQHISLVDLRVGGTVIHIVDRVVGEADLILEICVLQHDEGRHNLGDARGVHPLLPVLLKEHRPRIRIHQSGGDRREIGGGPAELRIRGQEKAGPPELQEETDEEGRYAFSDPPDSHNSAA